MPPNQKPWDDDDEDKTPYSVSGEALPSRKDAVRDMDVGEEIVARPRRKKAVEVDDDGELPADEPPVRKKKKRKRDRTFIAPDPDDEQDKLNEKREWIITGALCGVGFSLMLVGVVGVSGKYEGVHTLPLLLASLVGIAIAIPISVLALTVGGSVFGIGYGTPVSAVRNIAAVYMFMEGIDWIGIWLGAPLMGRIASMFIGYGILMNRFELDVWELWMTVIAMKAVGFVVHVVLFFAFLASAQKKEKAYVPEPPAAAVVARADGRGWPPLPEGHRADEGC